LIVAAVALGSEAVVLALAWPLLKQLATGIGVTGFGILELLLLQVLIQALSIWLACLAYWNSRIIFFTEGIQAPSLRGRVFIRWAEITSALGYHQFLLLETPSRRLRINLSYYQDPEQVIAKLGEYLRPEAFGPRSGEGFPELLPRRRRIQWRGVFLCAVGLSLMLFALYEAGTRLSTVYVSRDWPATSGQVIESRMDCGRDTCLPVIRYQYSVGGPTFLGDRLYPTGNESLSRSKGDEVLRRFPANAVVPVYFDPHDASSCFLERSQVPRIVYGILGVALIGLCMFVVCAVFTVKGN
jgi:hypothetical protein